MRTTLLLVAAVLSVAMVGPASALSNELAPDVPTDLPQQDFLICYSLGLPFALCYYAYVACSFLGFIPGWYTLCFYV